MLNIRRPDRLPHWSLLREKTKLIFVGLVSQLSAPSPLRWKRSFALQPPPWGQPSHLLSCIIQLRCNLACFNFTANINWFFSQYIHFYPLYYCIFLSSHVYSPKNIIWTQPKWPHFYISSRFLQIMLSVNICQAEAKMRFSRLVQCDPCCGQTRVFLLKGEKFSLFYPPTCHKWWFLFRYTCKAHKHVWPLQAIVEKHLQRLKRPERRVLCFCTSERVLLRFSCSALPSEHVTVSLK